MPAKNSGADRFGVDVDFVRSLAEVLEEQGLSEIALEDGDRKLRLTRGGAMAAAAPAPVVNPMAAPVPPPASAPAASAPTSAAGSSPAEPPPETHAGAQKSPMVGTAYLAPEPGAADFVAEGATVEKGDTLLIVEAMKVMNPIAAERPAR